MRDEDLAIVKKGYEAFGKGDLNGLRALSTPDCIWRTPGFGSFRAEYKGIDEVIGYLADLARQSGGTFKTEPESFLADDDLVACLSRNTGTRDGKRLDTQVIHLFRLHDGKIYEIMTYAAEPDRNAEFWS